MQQAGGIVTPYISDGLVFWLDGINKGQTAGAWTDLIGGEIFVTQRGNPIEQQNGWYFDGVSNLYAPNMGQLVGNNSAFTIEVCISASAANKIAIYLCPCILAEWNNKISYRNIRGSVGANPTYSGSLTTYKTISLNSVNGIADFSILNTSSNETWGDATADPFAIGGRYSDSTYGFIGTIHSVRIYNRYLTTDEMMYNQQIDNERFNLGL